jgi:hypothetical protein
MRSCSTSSASPITSSKLSEAPSRMLALLVEFWKFGDLGGL